MEFYLNTFITLVVVIDPVGLAPVFAGLTSAVPRPARRRMARRAVLIAALILFTFAIGGNLLLVALGVSLHAFRIAGGALLFLLALDMILLREDGLRTTTAPEAEEARLQEDISVFPLAIPLIAGPGAMTSLVLLMGRTEGEPMRTAGVLGMLALVLLLTLAALYATQYLGRLLGVTGANVISRVLGIVLAALAVQWIIDGLQGVGVVP